MNHSLRRYAAVFTWAIAALMRLQTARVSAATTAGGSLTSNTTWHAADGPVTVTSSLTVNSGVILTVEPGTTVYLNSGVNLTVANGGKLIAEGTTNAPILFSRPSGGNGRWGGITINGTAGSPETVITHAHIEFNGSTAIHASGGTVRLEYLTFGSTDHQYVSLDGSSFLLSHCIFPTTSAAFEMVHGTGGIKAGGRGIVRHCYFGRTSGYNDIMDFTGGNRPGQPIIEYYRNVFNGATDDILDLDGTDAWIEGNIFLHCHKNGAPDSSSAVSGGNDGSRTSEITIIGNLFYDCDEAATAKQGNFFTMINNTIVHITKTGGLDTASGVYNVRDLDPGPPTTFGVGGYLEANIIADVEQLVRNYDAAQTKVTFRNNILPLAWNGPGDGNRIIDPMLKHIPELAETQFTNWEEAQIMWDWFSLLPGSPAIGAGPNGLDQGGVIPLGASISGEPAPVTPQTSATLTVGISRAGDGIPAADWPEGSGYTHYKWRLDGGQWSAETPIAALIILTNLASGPHYVEVTGKRDSGNYQDNLELGEEAVITRSRAWTVEAAAPMITSATQSGTKFTVHFAAAAGVTYSLQAKDSLSDASWVKIADVPASATPQDDAVTDENAAGPHRFYRLVTPATP